VLAAAPTRQPSRRFSSVGDEFTVVTPAMGDSITEGTISEFTKAVGDGVADGDVVAIIETDKVSVDIRVDVSGVITEMCAAENDNIEVGAPLLKIRLGEVPAASASASTPPPPPPPSAPAPPAPPTPAAAPPTPATHTRIPSIKFTHGAANRVEAGSASTQTVQTIESGSYVVRRPMSQYTMDLIEMGGAEPY
jgi:pyruvate/2-oxoglutarate dehydrogenase complex dihydrolipoamide acyltransferase (E2) component